MIAIFGGSFNPPTLAHKKIVEKMLKREEISKVIILPMACNYIEKNNLIEEVHRYNMLKLSFKGNNKVNISSIDFISENQLRTFEYMRLLSELFNEDMCHIFGSDNLKYISTWDNAEEILSKYKIYIVSRYDEDLEEIIKNDDLLSKYRDNIVLINFIDEEYEFIKKIRISSTKVRRRLSENDIGNLDNLLDKDVKEYIIKNKLYM